MYDIDPVDLFRKKRNEALSFIKQQTSFNPDYLIILGTGLGKLADNLETIASVSYSDIPHFPVSTVESHSGNLLFGHLGGKKVVIMQGRFHYYEGYSLQQIVFPVRVLRELGVHTLLVSNAGGGMNPNLRQGDIMCITDHINMLGDNPLIGPNDDSIGPRFPDMSEPYSKELIALAEETALKNGIKMHQGVYVAVSGPCLETRAEYRFLRYIGADVVGMSTVPEVIAANHMGMKSLGISAVTDECFPDALKPVKMEEILAAADIAEPKLTTVMMGVLMSL
ncbi:purine-nucleoside phosphorylase [Balneolaceae bacterium ANBcel3]|nr:purine-nucleoside phosphorylase [Balneolaceae bacterium ANBcel3]